MRFVKYFYFLIRFAQTKITLFIFVSNWVIRENESFLLVEPCSRSNMLRGNKVTVFLSEIYLYLYNPYPTNATYFGSSL